MSGIYRYVAADKARGGKLYQRFRQGRKRYRKGVHSKRSVIPNPRSIEDRPVVVETRERFGDWEVDTVLGKHGYRCSGDPGRAKESHVSGKAC